MFSYFFTHIFLDQKKHAPQDFLTIAQTMHGFRIIWEMFGTIANLVTNQDTTLVEANLFTSINWYILKSVFAAYVRLKKWKIASTSFHQGLRNFRIYGLRFVTPFDAGIWPLRPRMIQPLVEQVRNVDSGWPKDDQLDYFKGNRTST